MTRTRTVVRYSYSTHRLVPAVYRVEPERKLWDVQCAANWWVSLGVHIDHTDPSITLHLPGVIIYAGRCVQPGLGFSLVRGWRRHET